MYKKSIGNATKKIIDFFQEKHFIHTNVHMYCILINISIHMHLYSVICIYTYVHMYVYT